MERTVKIEAQMGGAPTLLDLIKGTDLRRTIITCLMYASQNFAGNLIANQATFFFEREYIAPPDIFQAWMSDSPPRSRHLARPCFPAQSDQFVPSIRCERGCLVSYRLVRSSNHLSLGHSHEHHSALCSRHLRLCPTEHGNQLRPGLSRYHHLLRFCRYPRTDLIHHHRRDVLDPSSRFKHRCRPCRLLCRGDSHDLSSLAAAQPDRMEPRRQVRVPLGRYRLCLLDHGLLLSS